MNHWVWGNRNFFKKVLLNFYVQKLIRLSISIFLCLLEIFVSKSILRIVGKNEGKQINEEILSKLFS